MREKLTITGFADGSWIWQVTHDNRLVMGETGVVTWASTDPVCEITFSKDEGWDYTSGESMLSFDEAILLFAGFCEMTNLPSPLWLLV